MTFALTLTLLALLIEAAFGYSDRLVRAIGHPVIWIGRLISALDGSMNRSGAPVRRRKVAGVATLLILVAISGGAGWLIQRIGSTIPFGLLVVAILASSLLAQRSLYRHVAAVAEALDDEGLPAGRIAVSRIVGRDTALLDEAGVARGAIESLAENFSDGVVAPTFWMSLGGVAGGAAYKAVNTADSMIGHRTPRHEAFGWAAARFDDLVNLAASRLAAVLLIAAACLAPGMSGRAALQAVRRDARKHRSPNAGWPEAAVAGALDLALAGPRSYDGFVVDDATMGTGRRAATIADIRAALRLFMVADILLICTVGFLAFGLSLIERG
jgi:adenosylcobinamide-phosphate synthase